jgi:anti-sigma B factor antagonist
MRRLRKVVPIHIGGTVDLALQTRAVGRVTIVRCSGRIVAGGESVALREHVSELLLDRRSIVLHLGEVAFIDSSGLGTMVRTLSITRKAHGELKLCNVPEHVRKILEMTNLTKLFEAHESEEKAIAAFYRPGALTETPVLSGRSVLCLDSNADVLATLREVLRRAGYDVQTSSHLGDALMLMRVTRLDLLLLGPEMAAMAATMPSFQSACGGVPVIELGSDFSTSHAGEASAGLLEKIAARLNPKTA